MNDKNREQAKESVDMAADKAKQATDWVANKVETARNGAVDLAETVQDRAQTVAKSFAHTAAKAKDKAGEWLGDAAEPVQHFVEENYDDARQALNSFSRDATQMIRRYPITAVAIGLGVGLLLGRAAGGRA